MIFYSQIQHFFSNMFFLTLYTHFLLYVYYIITKSAKKIILPLLSYYIKSKNHVLLHGKILYKNANLLVLTLILIQIPLSLSLYTFYSPLFCYLKTYPNSFLISKKSSKKSSLFNLKALFLKHHQQHAIQVLFFLMVYW